MTLLNRILILPLPITVLRQAFVCLFHVQTETAQGMSQAVTLLRETLNRLLRMQLLLIAGVVGGFLYYMGWPAAGAALFGSAIALTNTFLQFWYLRRAERLAGADAGRNLRFMMRCALERFLATIGLLVLALGGLELEPLPLISGFITGQVALIFGGFNESSLRQNDG